MLEIERQPAEPSRQFVIGNPAGHSLKTSDLTVYRHVTCRGTAGLLATRKWLRDRAAFNYDPSMGWEIDRWFIWPDGSPWPERERPHDP
jgi:hypothetical protein